MVSNQDKWIRIFDIPETCKHKNGFTIYKVISMLYPESCPDAITKVTVWKRFNDFKKLHREIKALHKKLNITSKVPNLPSSSLFKRFDDETIKERKQNILNLLEYVGSRPQLFKSNEFVKFFEISHTPIDNLNGNINLIRADLNLPEEDFFTNHNSDDEHTISDTDSVATLSSLSPSVQNLEVTEPYNVGKLKKLHTNTTISSRHSDNVSIGTTTDSIVLIDGQIYPTTQHTSTSSLATDVAQYIIDASIHINMALELENNKKYEEAFVAYKTAIDILINYGKDDTNYDRKQLVRYKTEKYLVQAERIYNMYLAEEVKHLQQIEEIPEQPSVKRPLFDLYKYKVIKVIGNGMIVLHSDIQQLFYVKVIHKTMQFLNDHLILPENVPYMVKLYNHFNCENALFLILEFCSGTLLADYLAQKFTSKEFHKKDDEILKQIQEISDNESESSYSELINEYTNSKNSSQHTKVNEYAEREINSSDEFVKVDKDLFLPTHKTIPKNLMDEPIPGNMAQLLTSVKLTETDSTENSHIEGTTNTKNLIEQASNVTKHVVDETDTSFVIPEKFAVRWAAQLLLALEKLHTLGITCRDLQMKNLLVDEAGELKLTYMCNVNELYDLYTNKLNINLAPEIYSYHVVTDAADWWSFGAILYELLVGMPLSEVHPNGLTSYTHLKMPKYVSAEARSLLKQLLCYEPKDRLGSAPNGIEYIKSHPFFNSVSWDSLQKSTKFN